MDRRRNFRRKFAAQQARALALGLLTAVLLVAAYTFISGWRAAHAAHSSGNEFLVPLQTQVDLAALFSAIYGTILAFICVPIWMLLKALGYDKGRFAMTLGFLAPMVLWIAINQNGHWALLDLIVGGLPYGVCGSLAGLVVWWSRPPELRPND